MKVNMSVARKARKKKILTLAKGFRGRKKNCYKLAINVVRKKLAYEYRDRRTIKRNMRALWIQRISAAAKLLGTSYSVLMFKLKDVCVLNRKALSELAARSFEDFKTLIESYLKTA